MSIRIEENRISPKKGLIGSAEPEDQQHDIDSLMEEKVGKMNSMKQDYLKK